jgi:drug/metabolite transporter (DMT)-like permease
MGFVFGVAAAFFFSTTSVLVRVGQRSRANDDGVFMSVFVNVVALGLVALTLDLPPWSWEAFVAFVIGGVIGTVVGRTAMLRAVRLVGASRSNAFMAATPAVAAFTGWILLGETLTLLEFVGAAIVISGLLWLVRARSAGSEVDSHKPVPLTHYLIAAAAPTAFGTAFVFRKWGLERFDSAIMGAFLGAASAYLVIVLIETFRGKLGERIRENFGNVSWWFVGAGVSTTLALISQFTAFTYLEAWIVGTLQSTQAIITLGLSWLFLKQHERITLPLIGAVLLVVGGVVLISLPD